MRKLQSQGVHHVTITGADRQTSIDFWEGLLGMPFVFEQPNLDNPSESHLYFDPGDGRLITIFTNEERVPDPERTPHFCISETPTYLGRAVAALAGDPDVARWNGQSLSSGQLAQVYRFTDVDGTRPDCWRYMTDVVERAGAPADDAGYR